MDWEIYVQAGAALAAVLLLLLALSFLFRKTQPGMVARGKSRRLQLVEVLALDPQRRLVLLRRDNAEHLVLTGPQGDVVVEAGIAVATPQAAPLERDVPVARREVRPVPRAEPRVEPRVEPRAEARLEPRLDRPDRSEG
ncbi:hypothetical protein [Zavarzinia sp. CC-PAN008]|uniref:hypothetical protein n=1 Tax=Zavarzinia sp. CC-PAN008 TaxID=3243332 RepID=UPI003F7480AF